MGARAAQLTDRGLTARVVALDAWRGLIIVVMALDHANGFIAQRKLGPELWTGPFPEYGGDWAAFLTRWVTHLAAPGFFFLLGTGAVLFARSRAAQGWSAVRVSTQLAMRGALLITLQFIWENPAWTLGSDPAPWTYIGVLFALGSSLIVVSPLVRVPARWLAAVAVAVLIAVELTLPASGWTAYPAWQLFGLWPGFADGWFSLYPALPWVGVAILGMAFGDWVHRDRLAALSAMFPIGATAVVGFVVVRVLDGFGNIRPRQSNDLMGLLNLVKYPPAISFLLITIGLGLLAAAWFASDHGQLAARLAAVLEVYGRAPLFFYLIHLYLYAQLGAWFGGASLVTMYGWWLVGLAILYAPCRWFATFKGRRSPGSAWRFL